MALLPSWYSHSKCLKNEHQSRVPATLGCHVQAKKTQRKKISRALFNCSRRRTAATHNCLLKLIRQENVHSFEWDPSQSSICSPSALTREGYKHITHTLHNYSGSVCLVHWCMLMNMHEYANALSWKIKLKHCWPCKFSSQIVELCAFRLTTSQPPPYPPPPSYF